MKTLLGVLIGGMGLMMAPVLYAADAVLTWTAPAVTATNGAATGYRVYRGVTPAVCSATTALPILVPLGNVVTFTDPNVTQGTTLCYEVSGTNAGGEGARSNRVTLLVPTNPPGAPSLSGVIQ